VKRISTAACVALLVLGLVSTLGVDLAAAATAQDPNQPALDAACFPPASVDYPPSGGDTNIDPRLQLGPGHFDPGGRGHFTVLHGVPGDVYCGVAFSTPIRLPATRADAQGTLTYDVAVPADFELNAMHHVDIYRRHVKVGNFDFCVNKKGDISPTSACGSGGKTVASNAGGNLPKTGANHLLDLIRAAIVALGIGAAALYLRRRRLATRTA
jgi:hypothetical protein